MIFCNLFWFQAAAATFIIRQHDGFVCLLFFWFFFLLSIFNRNEFQNQQFFIWGHSFGGMPWLLYLLMTSSWIIYIKTLINFLFLLLLAIFCFLFYCIAFDIYFVSFLFFVIPFSMNCCWFLFFFFLFIGVVCFFTLA